MDELVEQLDSSHVTLDEADTFLKHPRYCDPKREKPAICDQENRRREWLENLKRKRETQLNSARGFDSSNGSEAMELDTFKKKIAKLEYKGHLMLSEWLVEVPSDIKENWICAVCPVGVRALVVAYKKKTLAFRRNGRALCASFPSCLPGGSEYTPRGHTLLDTIFHRASNMFYVIDILQWGVNTEDLEAEMRFYWLKTKLMENTTVIDENKYIRHKFVCVEHFPFVQLEEKMKTHPFYPGNDPKVDGILFYHREGTYVHGRSPLVTWLNPFMLPDILQINIASEYLSEKPVQYQKMDVEPPSVS